MSDDKKFDWNSAEDGKQEYHEFYAQLSAILAKKGCRFVLSPTRIRNLKILQLLPFLPKQ